MSKPLKVVILHGSDAEKDAVDLKEKIIKLCRPDVQVITFIEAKADFHLGQAIMLCHAELVETSTVIICLASPSLFKDNFLANIASMAIFAKKFLPVVFGHPQTKLDLWFSAHTFVDLNNLEKSDQEMDRFKASLKSYHLLQI